MLYVNRMNSRKSSKNENTDVIRKKVLIYVSKQDTNFVKSKRNFCGEFSNDFMWIISNFNLVNITFGSKK